MTKKEAVFQVIPEAVQQQRGGTTLPFSSHSLFYKIRPLFLQLLPGETLTASYCEQTLIPAYEREHGPIEGMYREPRGELHHPHDPARASAPCRSAPARYSAYVPPEWTFDKILVVEKAGLWPVIDAARLADRYDMAVVTSEGIRGGGVPDTARRPARPRRDRVRPARRRPSGYNIARTLGEETARMPGHHVDVVDLGLTVDDASRARHGVRDVLPGKRPAGPARAAAVAAALDWFTGTPCESRLHGKPTKWRCRRVELNAFTSPGLIAYIEDGLRANGADGKVIPPAEVLADEARRQHDRSSPRKAGGSSTNWWTPTRSPARSPGDSSAAHFAVDPA